MSKITKTDGRTKVVVHLAHPADHVRTPIYFNAICANRGINAVLVPWDVKPKDLDPTMISLKSIRNVAGMVVTIPHKEAVALHRETLSNAAQAMGAVNVIRKSDAGKLTGANFDGIGFVKGMESEGHTVKDKKVSLVGAGGAAIPIAHAAAGSDPSCLSVKSPRNVVPMRPRSGPSLTPVKDAREMCKSQQHRTSIMLAAEDVNTNRSMYAKM